AWEGQCRPWRPARGVKPERIGRKARRAAQRRNRYGRAQPSVLRASSRTRLIARVLGPPTVGRMLPQGWGGCAAADEVGSQMLPMGAAPLPTLVIRSSTATYRIP